MAFEQTQKTRVESKQFSGNWVDFITPQGNGGNATEPYVSKSQGIDLAPLAKGVTSVSNTLSEQQKQGAAAEQEAVEGEFLNRAYDIVELNTDSSGVLSARGEEQIRNLRREMGARGLNNTKIQSVLTAVGQDYKSTTQGLMQEEQRKHSVEQEKEMAKKAVEVYPELTGRTLGEQAQAGRNFYKKQNILAASLEVAANPNTTKETHDSAVSDAADSFFSLIGSDMLDKVYTGEVNAQDEQELASRITNSLLASGISKNIREARALGVELSASFVGKAREYRTAMEKLTVEEKERFLELKKNEARAGLYKTNPVLATKLSLVNWDITKLPEDYLDFLTNFDATKIGGDGETHYWQGGFDTRTANICVQNGTKCVADVGQRAINAEGLRLGDEGSAQQVLTSMMSDNMAGVLNAPEMAKQRPQAVAAYKEQIAGLMVNELRPHVLPKTGYVPSEGRAIDAGFWDSAEKINPILNKWKDGMRHIGMTDDEIVETGKNAMAALGVQIPDNTTNPESFYQESVRNIEQWMQENPIKRNVPFLDKSSEAYTGISGALNDFRRGEISEEEAIARMSALMGGIKGDLEEEKGTINIENTEPQGTIEQTQSGVVNMSEIEAQVLGSKEYKDVLNSLAQDNTISREQKSEAASIVFNNLVNKFASAAKELVGIKTANAQEIVPQQKETAKNFKVVGTGSGVKNNNIFNTRGKNKAKGFAKFATKEAAIQEAINDATTKVLRFEGDVMKLCSQYAPREDNNLTSRYCCGLLYRTPGVSDADKETINEIVKTIQSEKNAKKQRELDKEMEPIVRHYADKYKHLFYRNGEVVTVRPIVLWQALMETGTKLEYVG